MTSTFPTLLHPEHQQTRLQQTRHSLTHGRSWTPAGPQPLLSPRPCRRGTLTVLQAAGARGEGGGLDDLDVAVFRFTLGIPGFDDALIPRVVGVVGAALLAANHLLSDSTPTDAQVRAEVLGALLAAVGLVTPTIEQLLKERRPGRGRLAVSDSVEGATRTFALRSSLPDAAKQDAAWASFALLRNSNICGLVTLWEGQAVMCRGLVRLPASAAAAASSGDADAVLAALSQAFAAGPPMAAAYWPDRGSIRASGGADVPWVPAGVQTVLLQPIQPLGAARPASQEAADPAAAQEQGQPQGWLVLLSERPRALSASERAWAAAVAGKLWAALSHADS